MTEYITVVSVDVADQPKSMNSEINGHKLDQHVHENLSSFKTVLSINNQTSTTTISTSQSSSENGSSLSSSEIVPVYRLPGERLGFGLKFQGGTMLNERVQRLFIQSCAANSPASRARASFGLLSEGDEILEIDRQPVTKMTRIECVKCLKDSNVAINLLVCKGEVMVNGKGKNGEEINGDQPKKRMLPPPPPMVPPRKIIKKVQREQIPIPVITTKTIIPKETLPVAAELYLNTLDEESNNRNDESDETGSTISTVISNFSSETDLSLLSTTSTSSSSDLTKILTKPFQLIEREFNVHNTNNHNNHTINSIISSAVTATTNISSMSIDSMLFNDTEPNDFGGSDKIQIDIKSFANYENINIMDNNHEQQLQQLQQQQHQQQQEQEQQYENVEIKLPTPRPRSASLTTSQDTTLISNSPKIISNTIESWLNDSNNTKSTAINGTKDDKIAPKTASIDNDDNDDDENTFEMGKIYEPIKFECFAAGDDEEDEKLGPPELLNISEAYFNFSWCGNPSSSLATIGEAEEEFLSMEPQFTSQKCITGPIFIVNSVNDSDSSDGSDNDKTVETEHSIIKCNPDDREINNNTLYLQQKSNNNYNNNKNNNNICDKTSDNETTDNKLHCEIKNTFILATDTFTVPLVPLVKNITVEERTKNLLNSDRHFNKMSEPNSDNNIVTVKFPKTLTKELIEDSNNTVTTRETITSNVTTFKTFEHLIKESDKVVINKEKLIMITIDSNREMSNSSGSSDVSEIVTNQIDVQKVDKSKTLITKQIDEETQLNESKKMTSLPTLRASDIQMEQKILPELSAAAVALERSRLPPDGDEYPPNFIESNGIIAAEKPVKISGAVGDGTTIDFVKSPPIVTKATAIVAPLVPRKMFHSEEFGDVKPHFKSATLGRHRPIINWRNKDEKSEKSVKDKIAMFSNSTNDISHCLPRTPFKEMGSPTPQKNGCFTKSTENIFSSDSLSNSKPKISGNIKKKAMSVENLDDYEEIVEKRSRRDIEYTPIKKPSRNLPPLIIDSKSLTPQATIKMSKAFSVENLIDVLEESPAPSYNAGTLPRPPPTTAPPSLSRRISFSGYSNNQIEEHRRISITNILESRRKSMSKLRGLVIPEKVPENETQGEDKVLGLPVIRSTDCDRITSKNVFNRSTSVPQVPTSAPPIRTSSKSSYVPFHSVHSVSKNIVKAVPRKLYEKSKSHDSSTFSNKAPIVPPMKPPRTSLIISTTNTRSITTDESDTESVMSSRVSTPPISPVAKKSPLVRTFSSETNTSISSNSTLTSGSGSQASCSSNGSNVDMARKVNGKTPASTELNSSRKSILASSKSRSGRDCLEKSWRDEDSTDGGIDDDERKRTPKAKARSSVVNYKLVNNGDNIVDKVINVATYVEVMTSDSDEKADIPELPTNGVEKVTMAKATMSVITSEPVSSTMMSDMAKWVRSESTKTTEKIQMPEVKETMENKSVSKNSKMLEGMKKLNLSEIRKNFENKSTISPSVVSPAPRTPKEKPPLPSNHNRFSSWDSVASSSSGVSSELLGTGTGTNNSESLQTLQSDFGSFSSFGSSHSLITPQDLQLIIDEADPPLETPEAFVVVLQRETPESSIGITLAGGSDYEAKEITIHRILVNSPADKDGRLKRGDRLLSINGLSMRGLTHRESLSVLKAPRNDVVMVVTRSKSVLKTNSLSKAKRGSLGSLSSLSEKADSMDVDGIAMKKALHASRSLEMDLDTIANDSYQPKEKPSPASRTLERKIKSNVDKISIIKDGAGLGFSIDGGFDSPNGNKPLLIKKIFMGGAAERSSNLKVGDEILEINDRPIDRQTRIDVWNMIKAMPQGDAVKLTIKK